MWISIIVLAFLVVYGSIQAVQQKSVFPLMDSVLFRTIGADHKISQDLDSLNPILTEPSPKFLTSGWFSYWWRMFVLWLDIIIALWFIYIIIFALYKLFEGLNNTNPLMNVGYAIILFAILQLIVGLLIYPMSLAGQTLPDDKVAIMNDAFSHSYPFEGVVKLVSRIIDGKLLDKAYAFVQSDVGQIITNVPTSALNNTMVE
jgi:hypothetical protein